MKEPPRRCLFGRPLERERSDAERKKTPVLSDLSFPTSDLRPFPTHSATLKEVGGTGFIPSSACVLMLQYKAGYRFVDGGVHAQVIDFPAAITWGADVVEARQSLTEALLDVAEAHVEIGQPLPHPNPAATDPEMDFEEPIYLHLSASSRVSEIPAGEIAS